MMLIDFHIVAFFFQILLPAMLISGGIAILTWIIILLARSKWFKGKYLKWTLLGIALVIAASVGIYHFKESARQKALGRYPDIVFTGTKTVNNKETKVVNGRWDSSSNTYEKISEVSEEDAQDESYKFIDTDTGEEIHVSRYCYNPDRTAIYYSNGGNIYKYIPDEDTYKKVGNAEGSNDLLLSKMVFTADERNAYFFGTGYHDGKIRRNLYWFNIPLGRATVIDVTINKFYDLALSPDEKSIIFIGDGKIMKYDLETKRYTALLTEANPDKLWGQGNYNVKVSEDGRYIMYYLRQMLKNSWVYVYDTQTGKTEKVINTDMCRISDADWAK